ncbi:MAG: hypothetical protein BMS9Abin17_0659 [Acidimicrobiia bacterium]|nr:MAG: hypothetical protein BMS9Abin17_0659 [Acidimicrobiia bacterium]
MKRVTILTTVLLFILSFSAIAFAGDEADDSGDDSASTEVELATAQLRKAQVIADYFAPFYVPTGEESTEGTALCTEAENVDACEADLIAAATGDLTETIVMLRTGEPSIGWGALYKLMQIAAARDMTVGELLEEIGQDEDGGYDFGFGQLRKTLSPDEMDTLNETPRNLGQLKKQAREADGDQNRSAKAKGKRHNG